MNDFDKIEGERERREADKALEGWRERRAILREAQRLLKVDRPENLPTALDKLKVQIADTESWIERAEVELAEDADAPINWRDKAREAEEARADRKLAKNPMFTLYNM